MKKSICGVIVFLLLTGLAMPLTVRAQEKQFSLQVSPSPIVLTAVPGQTKSQELKIRNTGAQTELLKIGLREFTVSNDTGQVDLKDSEPADVKSWVKFSDPQFSVSAGATFTQQITMTVPQEASFTYSFALYISRATPSVGAPGKAAIEGSVAVFTLLSVDKPGAKAALSIAEFSSRRKVYTYLPSTFTLKLKNEGNTFLHPTGNVFIQRSEKSDVPLAALPVNDSGGHILPGSTRLVSSTWKDGFPVYSKSDQNNNWSNLQWNFGKIQNFRFGRYTAKAVVIYNDGVRDVPAQATVEFWVIPWLLVAGVLVLLLFLGVGIFTVVKKSAKLATGKHPKDA